MGLRWIRDWRIVAGLVFLSLAVAGHYLWQGLTNYEIERVRAATEQAALGVGHQLQNTRLQYIRGLQRMAARLEALDAEETRMALWDLDARAYLVGYPGVRALLLVDADGTILRMVMDEAAYTHTFLVGTAFGGDDPPRREMLDRALETMSFQVQGSLYLRTGRLGLIAVMPAATVDGPLIVVAALEYEHYFEQVLVGTASGYQVRMGVDGHVVYQQGSGEPRLGKMPVVRGRIDALGPDWEFEIWPEADLFAAARGPLPLAALLLALVAAAMVALSLRFAALARERLAAVLATEKELERRVAERTAELEAFSYTVSHDLRTPLRAISGFSELLQEFYADRLDADGRHYLRRVLEGSTRMGQLIEDMLQLARVSRQELSRELVDLSALAAVVVQRLREAQPERRVTVHIAEGLTASADPRLAGAVLENLLGNAWKFTGRREDAVIGFDAVDGVFRVYDNGVGFDMQYSSNLFGVFQRLHGVEEFPGTGVGLATVKRIVERHGGRVWAEAEVGAGASFFFVFGG